MPYAHTHSHPQPDANRIAGYALAIGFNALLLMLLLVPMQGPPTLKLPGETQPTISWYMPRPEPPAVPPTIPVQPRPPTPASSRRPTRVRDGWSAPARGPSSRSARSR